MSCTSSRPIDFSALRFNTPTIIKNTGEHAFTREYTFSVEDPHPPAPPTGASRYYTPEPLVNIVVRTINRRVIPPGEFYIYMDEYSDDFLQFSMAVFDRNGHIKPSVSTGVWGQEVNRGMIAYIEEIRVNPRYLRQGVGRWAMENLLKSEALAHCPFFFLWAAVLNTRSFFEGPDPEFDSKKRTGLSFFRAVGFRRVGGTWFFGYARDPEHLMRSLKVEDDAEETQSEEFTPFDAHDASFVTIHG